MTEEEFNKQLSLWSKRSINDLTDMLHVVELALLRQRNKQQQKMLKEFRK